MKIRRSGEAEEKILDAFLDFEKSSEINIYLPRKKFLLSKIPVKTKSAKSNASMDPFSITKTRRWSAQFLEMDENKRSQLIHFIQQYTDTRRS